MNPMQSVIFFTLILTFSVKAHTSYGGVARDLGPSSGSIPGIITQASVSSPYFKSITTQTVKSNFGWAHGTEAAFGDAHDIRAFRFSLAEAGWVTVQATTAARGTGLAGLLPAFSLYSGLLHTTGGSDYDTATVTQSYLASLGEPQPRRGAFDALHTWKMGNDAGNLSTLTYIGNAADGTMLHFGSALGIAGDGVPDGSVTDSRWLLAGDYTLIVGGGDIQGSDATGTYGVDVSLRVIPEPSHMLLGFMTGISLVLHRRRPSAVSC